MDENIIISNAGPGNRARATCAFCGKKRSAKCARYCSMRCWVSDWPSRFWAKVDKCGPVPAHVPKLGPCWLWTACRNARGYGSFGFQGGTRLAHRLSWEIHTGRELIGADVCVLHKCDNPACVRPEHLFIGSQEDNIRDRDAKGRARGGMGERHALARLNDELVRLIRARNTSGESGYAIGRALGIPNTTVKNVLCGRTWKHVK